MIIEISCKAVLATTVPSSSDSGHCLRFDPSSNLNDDNLNTGDDHRKNATAN